MIQKRIVVGGGGGADGIYIYYADGNNDFLSNSSILEDYDSEENDNWSIEFAVETSTVSFPDPANPDVVIPSVISFFYEFNDSVPLYDGSPTVGQTFYRIPIIRDGVQVNIGGSYRENLYCTSDQQIVAEFVKIG